MASTLGAVGAGTAAGSAVPDGGAPVAAAQSVPVSRSPAVGALFALGQNGTLAGHFCTASVVHSRSGDVVVTAAHCVAGRAPGSFVFVPQYHDGQAPLGVWQVSNVFVDASWSASSDPDDDFAFLTVSQPGSGTALEGRTGAEQLGVDAGAGMLLEVPGYPATLDRPISCRNISRLESPTQLEFDCGGYSVGTSGSPLLVGVENGLGTVVGVIGGYEEGGYSESVSYAAKFGARTLALYEQADGA